VGLSKLESISTLKSTRDGIASWIDVAMAVDALEQSSLLDEARIPWIRTCSNLSGLSVNHIRRMQSAARFAAEIAEKHEFASFESIGKLKLNSVEMISRIWKIDGGKAAELLRKAFESRVTYASLAGELKAISDSARRVASPISSGKAAAANFQDLCLDLLDRKAKTFDRNCLAIPPSGPNRDPNPEFVKVVGTGAWESAACYGIDFIDMRGMAKKDVVRKVVLPELTKATFLDNLWIVHAGENGDYLKEQVAVLGGKNIGLVEVSGDVSEILDFERPFDYPTPNRTRVWRKDLAVWLEACMVEQSETATPSGP